MVAELEEAFGEALDILAVVELLRSTITFMIAFSIATSRPGLNCSMCDAWRFSPCPRGSMTISLPPRLANCLKIGRGDRVVLGRVGADDDGDIGVLDLVEGRRHGAGADILHQRRDRGGVAEPGAVVDVVVAEALRISFWKR